VDRADELSGSFLRTYELKLGADDRTTAHNINTVAKSVSRVCANCSVAIVLPFEVAARCQGNFSNDQPRLRVVGCRVVKFLA